MRFWLSILLFLPLLHSSAQETLESPYARTHSTMFGFGYNNQLDTYLSPLEYTGTEIRFLQENIKGTSLLQRNVSMQNLIQANFSYTKSPTDDGKYLSGMMDWNIALHYKWNLNFWKLYLGPQLGLHGGFIYNTRNGNNPAQARLATDLNISGKAEYTFRLFHRPVDLRYQADILLAGLVFSPEYGQSYYEIFSLGHSGHNVCFTSPFSALSANQLLTFDFPIKYAKLRLGVQNIVRQSHVNELKTHDWTWLFIVGYVKQFQLVKPHK